MPGKAAALCGTAAIALALSACASSNGGSGSSSGPVTLMVMESQTGIAGVDHTAPAGAEAAASAINQAGGVDGHKIKIISCDTASDPNKSAQCARQAISQKVAAVVGSFDPIGVSTSLPLLESAKIPYIGPIGTVPAEYSNPVSFPVTSGDPGGTFGMVMMAKNAGCKTVGTFGDPAADGGVSTQLADSIKQAGMNAVFVKLPTGTSDVTPEVSELLQSHPNCVAYALSGQVAVQLFSAIRQQGSNAQLITSTGCLLPPFLKALGKNANGILANSQTPPLNSPDLTSFTDDLTKYQPNVQPNPFDLMSWYAVQTFKLAATGMSSITAPALLQKLPTMTDIKLAGLATFSFNKTLESKDWSRTFNPTIQNFVVKNGAYVPVNTEWHNMAAYLP